MIIVLCITLYTTRVLLQNLGIDDYGVYNVVCGFVSLFAFLNTSMSNGIQRYYNYKLVQDGDFGVCQVYNTAIRIQFIVALLVFLLTETLGYWYLKMHMVIPDARMSAAEWVYHLSVINFIIVIFQAPYTAVVLAHERMDFYAFVSVVEVGLKLLISFLIKYLAGDRLIWYGVLLVACSIITLLLYLCFSKVHYKGIVLKRGFNLSLFRNMLNFSGWNLFGSFSGIMKEQGINLILNLFYGPVVNAARGIAMQVSSGLQSFVNSLTISVRPQVVQSFAAGNIDRTLSLTYSISKLSCYILYLMALPVLAEIKFILKIWLGADIPAHTSHFVIIITLTAFLNNLNSAVSAVVHASGKMKVYQLATSATALSALPVAYFILQRGAEPEFALWTILIAMILVQIVALAVLKSIVSFNIRIYLREVCLPLMLVALMTVWIPIPIHSFISDGWGRLFLVFASCVVSVSFAIYFIGLNNKERILLRQMVSKLNKKKSN